MKPGEYERRARDVMKEAAAKWRPMQISVEKHFIYGPAEQAQIKLIFPLLVVAPSLTIFRDFCRVNGLSTLPEPDAVYVRDQQDVKSRVLPERVLPVAIVRGDLLYTPEDRKLIDFLAEVAGLGYIKVVTRYFIT